MTDHLVDDKRLSREKRGLNLGKLCAQGTSDDDGQSSDEIDMAPLPPTAHSCPVSSAPPEATQGLTPKPTPEPVAPEPTPPNLWDEMLSNGEMVLKEMPWVIPGPYQVGESNRRILYREQHRRINPEVEDVIATVSAISSSGTDRTRVLALVDEITSYGTRATQSIEKDDWQAYRRYARELSRLYNELHAIIEQRVANYNIILDQLLILREASSEARNIAKKYQRAHEYQTLTVQFAFLIYRAVRAMEIQHIIDILFNNIMPLSRVGRASNTAVYHPIQLMRRVIFHRVLSSLPYTGIEQYQPTLPYDIRMDSVYRNLLEEIDQLERESEIPVRPLGWPNEYDQNSLKAKIDDGNIFHTISASKGKNYLEILALLKKNIKNRSVRLANTIAQHREELNTLRTQLNLPDKNQRRINSDELLDNVIQMIHEARNHLDNLSRHSPEYLPARNNYENLQDIRRVLDAAMKSGDQEKIQQAVSTALKNDSIKSLLAKKKFIVLLEPHCQPFKETHPREDDDGAGGSGHDPKPSPSGENTSLSAPSDKTRQALTDLSKRARELQETLSQVETTIQEILPLQSELVAKEKDCLVSRGLTWNVVDALTQRSCDQKEEIGQRYQRKMVNLGDAIHDVSEKTVKIATQTDAIGKISSLSLTNSPLGGAVNQTD